MMRAKALTGGGRQLAQGHEKPVWGDSSWSDMNGGKEPASGRFRQGWPGIGIGRCEFLVLKEGLCGQSAGKGRMEGETEMGQKSRVRTEGLYSDCRGKPLNRGVVRRSLHLQKIPLSRKSLCPVLSRTLLPGFCILLGVIIYSASFHFQKYPCSDDKSQDSPDSGHSKEKLWGLPSCKLSGQLEVSAVTWTSHNGGLNRWWPRS